MEPIQIVQRPALTLVGLKYRGKNQNNEVPQLWGQFMARFHEIDRIIDPGVCYGAQDNFDNASGEFDYLAAYEAPPDSPIPAGMERWQIDANEYAVFPTTLATIHQSYDAIYGTWLPQSGYRRAPGAEFELYDETFQADDPHSTFYLYVPLAQ